MCTLQWYRIFGSNALHHWVSCSDSTSWNREINQMCECFLLQVQHTVFVQLDHSSICLSLNKKGIFFLKNLSFFQSSWYSSWHFGFRKLTGPGLGPISLRGWPGASRTFRVISMEMTLSPLPPLLIAFQHHGRGAHLSALLLSFLHIPSSPSARLFSFSPSPGWVEVSQRPLNQRMHLLSKVLKSF